MASALALQCCNQLSYEDPFIRGTQRQFSENICQGRPAGGSGIPVYPKKFAKIPKNSSKYTQIIPSYTLYLKFKESDIPNTRM